jgi:hypothetical protein
MRSPRVPAAQAALAAPTARIEPGERTVEIQLSGPHVPVRVIAVVPDYQDAEAIVERLVEEDFPLEKLTIVGRDLKLVEHVMGRTTWVGTALAGALAGAAIGWLFGLVFGLILAPDSLSLVTTIVYWIVVSAVFGALMGLATHSFNGRKFSSATSMTAVSYAVMVELSAAEDALRLLEGTPELRASEAPLTIDETPSPTLPSVDSALPSVDSANSSGTG